MCSASPKLPDAFIVGFTTAGRAPAPKHGDLHLGGCSGCCDGAGQSATCAVVIGQGVERGFWIVFHTPFQKPAQPHRDERPAYGPTQYCKEGEGEIGFHEQAQPGWVASDGNTHNSMIFVWEASHSHRPKWVHSVHGPCPEHGEPVLILSEIKPWFPQASRGTFLFWREGYAISK